MSGAVEFPLAASCAPKFVVWGTWPTVSAEGRAESVHGEFADVLRKTTLLSRVSRTSPLRHELLWRPFIKEERFT